MHLNKKLLTRVFALTLIIMAISMIPSLIIAFINHNHNMIKSFLLPMTIYLFIGGLVVRFSTPSKKSLNIRDCYMMIFLIIVISCLCGAAPFYIGIKDANIVDAIFESTAGLSTTSATVFYEPTMESALILWKAVEHWIGGISILIFIISIIPMLGVGDQQIATAEGHGKFLNKVAPRSFQIIKYVCLIYAGITLLAFLYFILARTGAFDALILSLSTSSTAGILLHPEGISYYNSSAVELGVSVLSIFSGLSFVLYIQLLKRNFKDVIKNMELRFFMAILLVSTLIIGIDLFRNGHGNLLKSMEDSFFQVSSFATTSGFALQDYTLWPSPSIFVLISLMIVGGCSASTTGSIKVIRLLIIIKLISRGFVKRIHPRAVRAVKVGNSTISTKMVASVTSFSIMYFLTILFSTLVLSLQNLSIESTLGATLGVISNSGISFGDVGMSGSYNMFAAPLKLFLSFLMIVGRLGFMTVAIVFLPSFWNPNKVKSIKI